MPLTPSTRAQNVIASPIRKYVPLITAAESDGVRVHRLHVGDPDLDAPEKVLARIRGYADRKIPYTPSVGIPALVDGWREYYARLGVTLSANDVVATNGCAEAIQFAMLAVTDPGDDVVCFEPLYSGFKATAGMIGVRLVPVSLSIDDNFRVPAADAVERAFTPNAKAIIIINPDNPTGKVWTRDEIRAVLAVAAKRDVFVIMDETYREIVFSGAPSTALTETEYRDRVIVIDSLSKRFSLPGARLGAVVSFIAPVMDGVRRFSMARLSGPVVEQQAVVPMLLDPGTYVDDAVATYKARRDAAVDALAKIPGVVVGRPEGAFYVVARLPVPDTDAFVRWLLTAYRAHLPDGPAGGETVAVTPIRDFYATPDRGVDEIRIALVQPPEVLTRAIGILADAIAAYPKV